MKRLHLLYMERFHCRMFIDMTSCDFFGQIQCHGGFLWQAKNNPINDAVALAQSLGQSVFQRVMTPACADTLKANTVCVPCHKCRKRQCYFISLTLTKHLARGEAERDRSFITLSLKNCDFKVGAKTEWSVHILHILCGLNAIYNK